MPYIISLHLSGNDIDYSNALMGRPLKLYIGTMIEEDCQDMRAESYTAADYRLKPGNEANWSGRRESNPRG